jgi:hypothetical protein
MPETSAQEIAALVDKLDLSGKARLLTGSTHRFRVPTAQARIISRR